MRLYALLLVIGGIAYAGEPFNGEPKDAPAEAYSVKGASDLWALRETALENAMDAAAQFYFYQEIAINTWDHAAMNKADRCQQAYYKYLAKWMSFVIKYERLFGRMP